MALKVNVYEAKVHFSKFPAWVGAGEEIIIAKAGKFIARLVPVEWRPARRTPGSTKGKITISPDFDALLPESVLEAFEK